MMRDTLTVQEQLLRVLRDGIQKGISADVIRVLWQALAAVHVDIDAIFPASLTIVVGNPRTAIRDATLLHVAIQCGDLEAVQTLVALGANPNMICGEGSQKFHPLRLALDNRHYHIASHLLHCCAVDPNQPEFFSETTLYSVGAGGRIPGKDHRAFDLGLVSAERKSHGTVHGKTTISLVQNYIECGHEQAALILIEHGAAFAREENIDPTTLQDIRYKLMAADPETFPDQLKVTAAVTATNVWDYVPSSLCLLAYENGLFKVVEAILVRNSHLVHDVYPTCHRFAGNTMLHRAVRGNSPEHVKMLLDKGAHCVAFNGEGKNALAVLLSRGDINGNGPNTHAALLIAQHLILAYIAETGQLPVLGVIISRNSVDVVNKGFWDKVNQMINDTKYMLEILHYAQDVNQEFNEPDLDKILAVRTMTNTQLVPRRGKDTIEALDRSKDTTMMGTFRIACMQKFDRMFRTLDSSNRDKGMPFAHTSCETRLRKMEANCPIIFNHYLSEFFSRAIASGVERDPTQESSIGMCFVWNRLSTWFSAGNHPHLYQRPSPVIEEVDEEVDAGVVCAMVADGGVHQTVSEESTILDVDSDDERSPTHGANRQQHQPPVVAAAAQVHRVDVSHDNKPLPILQGPRQPNQTAEVATSNPPARVPPQPPVDVAANAAQTSPVPAQAQTGGDNVAPPPPPPPPLPPPASQPLPITIGADYDDDLDLTGDGTGGNGRELPPAKFMTDETYNSRYELHVCSEMPKHSSNLPKKCAPNKVVVYVFPTDKYYEGGDSNAEQARRAKQKVWRCVVIYPQINRRVGSLEYSSAAEIVRVTLNKPVQDGEFVLSLAEKRELDSYLRTGRNSSDHNQGPQPADPFYGQNVTVTGRPNPVVGKLNAGELLTGIASFRFRQHVNAVDKHGDKIGSVQGDSEQPQGRP